MTPIPKSITIPTFIYEQGLPGIHQLRASGKQVYTVAQIVDTSMVFSESTSQSYKADARPGKEIARIPVSSVRKITVIDLDSNRRVKRITANSINKVFGILAGGALHMSIKTQGVSFTAAGLVIDYVNEDGILFQAIFKIPMGTKANEVTKTAMERVLDIRSKIEKVDKLDKILTGSAFLEDSPFLALADSLLEKVETARTIIALLSSDDSAIPIAKATAEMLALFTQNPGFCLSYVQQSTLT